MHFNQLPISCFPYLDLDNIVGLGQAVNWSKPYELIKADCASVDGNLVSEIFQTSEVHTLSNLKYKDAGKDKDKSCGF